MPKKIIWTDKYSAKDLVEQEIDDKRYDTKKMKKYEKSIPFMIFISILFILFGFMIIINAISLDVRFWAGGLFIIGIGSVLLYWCLTGKFPDWDK